MVRMVDLRVWSGDFVGEMVVCDCSMWWIVSRIRIVSMDDVWWKW